MPSFQGIFPTQGFNLEWGFEEFNTTERLNNNKD